MTLADVFNLQQWIGAYKPAATPQVYQYSLPLVAGIVPEGGIAKAMFGTGKAAVAAAPKVASAFPTWAKIAGAGAGIGVAALGLSNLFGKSAPVTGGAGGAGGNDYSNRSVYNPVTTITANRNITNTFNNQYDYSQTFNTISNSPNSSISNKKTMGLSSSVTPTLTSPVSVTPKIDTSGGGGGTGGGGGAASSGIDWITITAILTVGLIAYGYTSGGKKK